MKTPSPQTKLSISSILKTSTQAQHDHIEKNPLTASIPQGTISLEDYKLLLSKFYGFHLPIEQTFAQYSEWQSYQFDIQARKKTPHLIRDLKALGFQDSVIAKLAICPQLPIFQSFASCLGILYVLEGSTLGGQILYRHIQEKFHYDENNGLAYFHGYGKSRLGSMWNSFKDFLERYAQEQPHKQEEIIQAASQTFSCLDQWLLSP